MTLRNWAFGTIPRKGDFLLENKDRQHFFVMGKKMENTGYSLADIGAMMNNRGYDGWGNQWWMIILFFFIFGWGNNRRGDAATTGDMAQGFADNRILSKLDGLGNGMCDGFYAQNTTMLNGFNTLGREIADNRFAAQQCCCETNRNIDAVRYENSKNTCDIVRAIEKDGEATRALINHNVMQDLRDKLADRDRDLQTANFQLSQQAQSTNIINTLRPVPQPAYLTCSPYQSSVYAYQGLNGYGCCGY